MKNQIFLFILLFAGFGLTAQTDLLPGGAKGRDAGSDSTFLKVDGGVIGKRPIDNVYKPGGTLGIATSDTAARVNVLATETKPGINFKTGTSGDVRALDVSATPSDNPNLSKFSLTGQNFPGVNAPLSTRPNYVYRWGYNFSNGGGRLVNTEPAIGLEIETYWANGSTGTFPVTEFHLTQIDTLGTTRRLWSNATARGGHGFSNTDMSFNKLNFLNYSNTNRIAYDFTGNTVDHNNGPMSYNFNTTNVSPINQKGGNGTLYSLLRMTTGNELELVPAGNNIYTTSQNFHFQTSPKFYADDNSEISIGRSANPSNVLIYGNLGVNSTIPSGHGSASYKGIFFNNSDCGIIGEPFNTAKSISLSANAVRGVGGWNQQDNTQPSFLFNAGFQALSKGITLYYNPAGTPEAFTQLFAMNELRGFAARNFFFGGTTTATAKVHLAAGSTTANTGPLKFTLSGAALVTTPEPGLIEPGASDNRVYYTGSSGTRNTIAYITDITVAKIGAFTNTATNQGLVMSGDSIKMTAADATHPGGINLTGQVLSAGTQQKTISADNGIQLRLDDPLATKSAGFQLSESTGTNIMVQVTATSPDADNGNLQVKVEDTGTLETYIEVGALNDKKGVYEKGGLYEDPPKVVTTATYTLQYGDRNLLLNATDMVLTLQEIGTGAGQTKPGRVAYFFNDNSTSVTLTGGGGQDIIDANTLVLSANTAVTLIATTSGKWIVKG